MSGCILVTGAAGGIGQAVAGLLGRRCGPVAAIDADAATLEAAVASMRADGVDVAGRVADVSSAADVDAAVDWAERERGPIVALVNAAGILRVGEAATLDPADWSATLAVNATGVFLVSSAVARRMIGRGHGSIVTVTSNATHVPRWGMAAYAASKAAATSFTKCLGLELAGHGIRCNTVSPGSTCTPMLASLWSDGDPIGSSVEGAPDKFRVGIPLRRVARPPDIAAAVAFLLSEEAVHITLQDLTVDGGAALGA